MLWAICEVNTFFDKDFDGTLCTVKKVLQVFDSGEKANAAFAIMDPCRYGDYDTAVRIVKESNLDTTFR